MEREKMNKEITALYCRLSKEDKQSGESMSISTQKEMLMEGRMVLGIVGIMWMTDIAVLIPTEKHSKKCWMIFVMERLRL